MVTSISSQFEAFKDGFSKVRLDVPHLLPPPLLQLLLLPLMQLKAVNCHR